MRSKLPERRLSVTAKVIHIAADKSEQEYLITFGFDREGYIREVFCADPRIGSDIHALLTDSCILLSILMQTGSEPERLVKSLGENRNEGETSGPPSSIIGAIARAILTLQKEADDGKLA